MQTPGWSLGCELLACQLSKKWMLRLDNFTDVPVVFSYPCYAITSLSEHSAELNVLVV